MKFSGTQYLTSRIGRRMLGVFALCALVPVTTLALVSYRAARADLEGQARERLHDATKNLGMSMLERFLFVVEELEFAAERIDRGEPLAMVQAFPDRLRGIVRVRGEDVIEKVGGEVPLDGLRDADREQIAAGDTAISFPSLGDGSAATVIWLPLGDGTVLAASVEPDYGWGAGLQAVLPVNTDVIVLTTSGDALLSTVSAGATQVVRDAGGGMTGRQFDAEIDGIDYFGGRWSLPLRFNFGHPGLVLISLTERTTAMRRAAGFGKEYLLLGLTSLWIVLLLSISQIRRNLAPLDHLAAATDRMAERDFTHRVEVTSDDEFSDLAESFNFMAGRLESQFAHLATIADIDRSILSSVDLETVLTRTQQGLAETYPDLIFGVARLEVSSGRATVHTGSGTESYQEVVDIDLRKGRALAESNERWTVLDDIDLKNTIAAPLRQRGAEVVVAMPVAAGDGPTALLLVGRPAGREIDTDDLAQLRQIGEQLGVALANASLVTALDDMKQGALLALAGAVDAKSSWTTGHSERVTRLALQLGSFMGVSPARLEVINRGGLLHDIGKIGVPNAVLDKPGKLDDDEFAIMKSHPVIGARILEPIAAYADVLPIVLQHHERMDGRGYPYGIGADEFDPDARIVAVADVFDACSSDRPYREGMPLARVMSIIGEGAGSHFDPIVAEALADLVAEQAEFFERLRAA